MRTYCRVAVSFAVAAIFLCSTGSADILRSRFLEVNRQAIRDADQPGDVIPLRLFRDAAYDAVLEEAEDPRLNGFVWKGRMVDHDNSWVVMVDHDGVMAGVVVCDNKVFRLRYAGSGRHVLEEVNPRSLRWSGQDAVTPGLFAQSFATSVATGSHQLNGYGDPVLDVLMVYTTKAGKILVKKPDKYWHVDETDWKRAIESQARLSIAVANAAPELAAQPELAAAAPNCGKSVPDCQQAGENHHG